MSNINYELNEKIHAIIINPYLSWENLHANCDLIKKYNIRNISTSLNFLAHIKEKMSNHKVKINALISFPFSDLPISFIQEITCFAKDNGANGIEYSPNFLNLSRNNLDAFANEIQSINESELPVTIIINNTKLDKELFEKALSISSELGITKFQFGDTFGSPTEPEDIDKMLKLISNNNFIKIVGGIKKISQIIDLFDLGVDSVGTSNFYEIFKELRVT